MKRHSIGVGAVVAVLVLAVAAGAAAFKPTKVVFGNIEIELNGGIRPTKLPKDKLAPVTLKISGRARTLDGTHLPALKEIVIEGDKNGAVNAKGRPTCTAGRLQATTTTVALKNCGPALIGEGTTAAEVEFPEQKPITVNSKLLAFNGGVKGGTTTIYVHAYFSSPVNGAIVTTAKVTKEHNGRYGIKSVATIPKIAGGFGSAKSFTLTFKRGYILAKCPDGHLNAKGTAVFADGSRLSGVVVRSCTPKG